MNNLKDSEATLGIGDHFWTKEKGGGGGSGPGDYCSGVRMGNLQVVEGEGNAPGRTILAVPLGNTGTRGNLANRPLSEALR